MAERQVAVVTGANRGIGREVVRQLAEHGFSVVLGSRDLAKGRRAAHELDPSQKVIAACQLDVSNPASVAAMSRLVSKRFDRVDVLVNNAAILYDSWQRAAEADLETVEQALQTNLVGAWRTTQALLPLLRRSSHPRIVNVSSEGGSIAGMTTGGTPAYSVSKAALNALTRLLAGELREDGILVNAVCPRAGPPRTWAAGGARSPRAPPAQSGQRCYPTAAPPAVSSATEGHFRGRRHLMRTNRIEAFSDGVFAIAKVNRR